MQGSPGDDSQPPVAIDVGSKLVMLCGGLLGALALMGVTSVLPLIETELAHTATDRLLVKQLVGIVGLAMMAGAPLAGFLADRVGARRVLLASAIIYAIAGTSGLYLNSLPALIVGRWFVGMSAAAIQIIAITLINTRLQGVQRAKWMGLHIAVATMSTMVLHPIAGSLGELGWRGPFALYGLGLLLAPLALAIPAGSRAVAHTVTAVKPARFVQWFPFRFLLLGLMVGSIVYLPMVYTPFIARARGISSPQTISLILMADAVLGGVMAMLYGKAREHFSAVGVFTFCFTCTALGTGIAALSTNFTFFVIGLLIFGFGIGSTVPNLLTALSAQIATDQQGRAAGLVKAMHFMAAPLVVTLAEPVTRTFGPVAAMWMTVCMSLIALCMLLARPSLWNAPRKDGILADAPENVPLRPAGSES